MEWWQEPIHDQLVRVYDESGTSGVFEFARVYHPAWPWEPCEPCEESTPTFDGVCAVCFHDKENN